MKSIFLLGLLEVQSLAEPVHVARSPSPAVDEHRRAVAFRNEKRTDFVEWPAAGKEVNMRGFDSAGRGEPIKTSGLASCIAVVVYNKTLQEDDRDKWLAPISAVGWEGQLQNRFNAMDLSDPRVMTIFPVPEDTVSPDAMRIVNEKSIQAVFDQWSNYDPDCARDGSRMNEAGGSSPVARR